MSEDKMIFDDDADATLHSNVDFELFLEAFEKPYSATSYSSQYNKPLPDLKDDNVLSELSSEDQANSIAKIYRWHGRVSLEKGDYDSFLTLQKNVIDVLINATVSNNWINILRSFFYENIAWGVNQLSHEIKKKYIDQGVEAAENAIALTKEGNIRHSEYRKVEFIILRSNLLLDKYKLSGRSGDSNLIEKIYLLEIELAELLKPNPFKAAGVNFLNNLLQHNRLRLIYCRYLDYTMQGDIEASKAIMETTEKGLQFWLNYLKPKNKIKLAQHVPENWRLFRYLRLEKALSLKADISMTTGGYTQLNEKTINEIIGQIRELINRATHEYSRLGQHRFAHFLLCILDSYIWLSDRDYLDFIVKMSDIEGRENILKLIDRLESFDDKRLGDVKNDRLVASYYYRLARAYERIGLNDFAKTLYEKSSELYQGNKKIAPALMRLDLHDGGVDTPEYENDSARLGELIKLAITAMNERMPERMTHVIRDISWELSNITGDISDDDKKTLKTLANLIEKFINFWVQFSEKRSMSNVDNRVAVESLYAVPESPKHYAAVFCGYAINISLVFCPHIVPRNMRHLGAIEKSLDRKEWFTTFLNSAFCANRLNDPANFLKAFKFLKEALEKGYSPDSSISGQLADLWKCMVALAEKTIERVMFPVERANLVEKFAPYVEFATLKLVECETDDKGEWVFRGSNLLLGRSLTGARMELPPRDSVDNRQDWHTLRKLFMEEHLQISRRYFDEENIENRIEEQLEKIAQKKYELYRKIDMIGYGACAPKPLQDRLRLSEKKICVLTFASHFSGTKIVISGVRNYGSGFPHMLIELEEGKTVETLKENCLQDIDPSKTWDKSTENLSYAFDKLIAPIWDIIKDADLIYFVTDEQFYNLPFHALYGCIEKKKKKMGYFIQKFEVAYIRSPLLLWHMLGNNIEIANKGVAIGCSTFEFGWNEEKKFYAKCGIGTPIVNAAAIRTILSSTDRQGLLYIVGHKPRLSNDEDPFRAYIELHEEGMANTHEISSGDFMKIGPKAHLVFLNCCSTGAGIPFGKDLYGFPFALMASANSSCLLAAVPVFLEFNREFARTMVSKIFDGKDLSTCFAASVREYLQDANYSAPCFWAPYYLHGDFRAIPTMVGCVQ